MDLETHDQAYFLPPVPSSELMPALRDDVLTLASLLGERNLADPIRRDVLEQTADFLVDSLRAAGLQLRHQRFPVGGIWVENIEAELIGNQFPEEIVVIGAHYDSARGSPGANDNASGVAGLLALARAFAGRAELVGRTLRLVAFVNEEAPYTYTPHMGSLVYARRCRARHEQIAAMLSLEAIGSFTRERHPGGPGAHGLPWWPADAVAVVANLASRSLATRVAAGISRSSAAQATPVVLPGVLSDAKSSDHWPFWTQAYPAVMVTDAGPLRARHFHPSSDTPANVDYPRLTEVVSGLEGAVLSLVGMRP